MHFHDIHSQSVFEKRTFSFTYSFSSQEFKSLEWMRGCIRITHRLHTKHLQGLSFFRGIHVMSGGEVSLLQSLENTRHLSLSKKTRIQGPQDLRSFVVEEIKEGSSRARQGGICSLNLFLYFHLRFGVSQREIEEEMRWNIPHDNKNRFNKSLSRDDEKRTTMRWCSEWICARENVTQVLRRRLSSSSDAIESFSWSLSLSLSFLRCLLLCLSSETKTLLTTETLTSERMSSPLPCSPYVTSLSSFYWRDSPSLLNESPSSSPWHGRHSREDPEERRHISNFEFSNKTRFMTDTHLYRQQKSLSKYTFAVSLSSKRKPQTLIFHQKREILTTVISFSPENMKKNSLSRLRITFLWSSCFNCKESLFL